MCFVLTPRYLCVAGSWSMCTCIIMYGVILAGIVTICRSPACEVGVSIFAISTHFCFYFAPSPFPFFSSFYNFLWLSFFISTFPFLFFYSFSVFCWSSPSLFLFPFPNFTFFLILILDHFCADLPPLHISVYKAFNDAFRLAPPNEVSIFTFACSCLHFSYNCIFFFFRLLLFLLLHNPQTNLDYYQIFGVTRAWEVKQMSCNPWVSSPSQYDWDVQVDQYTGISPNLI